MLYSLSDSVGSVAMSSTSRAKLSLGTRRTDKSIKTGRYHHQRSRSWAPVADGECRLGATGLMVFEAARQGDLENLQFLMGLPEGRYNKCLLDLRTADV